MQNILTEENTSVSYFLSPLIFVEISMGQDSFQRTDDDNILNFNVLHDQMKTSYLEIRVNKNHYHFFDRPQLLYNQMNVRSVSQFIERTDKRVVCRCHYVSNQCRSVRLNQNESCQTP